MEFPKQFLRELFGAFSSFLSSKVLFSRVFLGFCSIFAFHKAWDGLVAFACGSNPIAASYLPFTRAFGMLTGVLRFDTFLSLCSCFAFSVLCHGCLQRGAGPNNPDPPPIYKTDNLQIDQNRALLLVGVLMLSQTHPAPLSYLQTQKLPFRLPTYPSEDPNGAFHVLQLLGKQLPCASLHSATLATPFVRLFFWG